MERSTSPGHSESPSSSLGVLQLCTSNSLSVHRREYFSPVNLITSPLSVSITHPPQHNKKIFEMEQIEKQWHTVLSS